MKGNLRVFKTLLLAFAFIAPACIFLTNTLAEPTKTSPAKSTEELLRPSSEKDKPLKFQPATKEQADAAIGAAKKRATEIETAMDVKFGTIETPHFLIFTDWDKREYDFLKTNVEAAYEAVSRQFEIPVKDNVFIGKLPIYMFAKHDIFRKFAKELDNFNAPDGVAGYYQGNSLGVGHMAMWKPDIAAANGNIRAAERQWAYVLTHEFTHAFVARYRTNAFIPRWLNEGVAEVVAYQKFPRPYIYNLVRERAKQKNSIQDFFVDKGSLLAADYHVAQTVVETMIVENPRTFLSYFNDIKDGMKPEDALKKNYKTDLSGLETAWRRHIKDAR